MRETPLDTTDDASELDHLYLPAVAARPDFGRLEAVLTDLFGGHGVVLLPDTYSE